MIDALMAAYRERFVPVGIYENTVYPGIPDVLAACAARGQTLALATSKPTVFAREILRHFGLAPHFTAVAGSYLDGRRSNKAAVIRHALRLLGAQPSKTAMVGDRRHDLLAAQACGVTAIGAGWGYAPPGELEACGPAALCGSPPDLDAVLRAR